MQQQIHKKTAVSTILTAWLAAGTLDIVAALILFSVRNGKNPTIVLNYIASAVLGKNAYAGGWPVAIAGLLLHYGIALLFAVLLFMLYPKLYTLLKNKIVIGLLYGIFVWLAMNLLVLPLTQIPPIRFHFANALEGALILVLAIGLPLSLITHAYYYDKVK